MTTAHTSPPAASTHPLGLSTEDPFLVEAFDWACTSSMSFVRTGRSGEVPSYWAGLQDRPMFYSRDVSHQALGAHLLGLDDENYSMLDTFVRSANAARGHYPLWAFTFDGAPAELDYRGDDDFVRETPAAFEIAETCLRLHRWTGDERYVTEPQFTDYYAHLVCDFLPQHDVLGIGVAGESGTSDIFAGRATYNEGPTGAGMQVGADGLAAQWSALTLIAETFPHTTLGEQARAGAAAAKTAFGTWWEPAGQRYLTGLSAEKRYTDFAFEPSWYPAVKGLLPAGERAQAHLRFVSEGLEGTPPSNIEAYTYLPEAFLAYDHDDEALRWIRHLIDSRSDYPEVPYTLVQHLALGLTGLDVLADGSITTRNHLGQAQLEARGVRIGSAVVDVHHDGQCASTLTVVEGSAPVRWRADVAGQTREHVVEPGRSVRSPT